MDYKYIEQLLERYWECATSLEEEQILRTFFRQQEVPDHLAKFREFFEYEHRQSEKTLGRDFDERLLKLAKTNESQEKATVVKAQRLTLNYRLRPLYRAAAIVSVFLLVGGAVQRTFNRQHTPEGWDYNAANYQDTYQVPQDAFEAGMGGIEEIQNLLRTTPSPKDTLSKNISKTK